MKKFINLFLSFLIVLNFVALFPQKVNAANTFSGVWADNICWTIDFDSGTLTLSGSGEMPEYAITFSISIGDKHFGDSDIKKLVIEDGITTVNQNVNRWGNLTSITVADSVESLGYYTFGDLTNLKNISLSKNITEIPESCFNNCTGLEEIELPESVKIIRNYAFENCSSLKSITIPDNVTTIGAYTFGGCSSITSITIPENVESIEYRAFEKCLSLKSIDVDENNSNYKSIDGVLFELFNSELGYLVAYPAGKEGSSYEIPGNVRFLSNPFAYNKHLENIIVSPKCTIYYSKDGVLFESSSNRLLAYPPGKKESNYTVPLEVSYIDTLAFAGTENLTTITLHEKMDYIGLTECSSLKNVITPENATGQWSANFRDCINLESISVPKGIRVIYDIFYGCTNLKSVQLPNTVTSIEGYAFQGCSSLENINIHEGITSIGDQAFFNCSSLKNITLPEKLTTIGYSAFSGCKSLSEIAIPESVTSLGGAAFNGCSGLKNIKIPDTITNIPHHLIADCSGLISIKIPETVTEIGPCAFLGCSGLTSIKLPDNITCIERSAFQGCSNLTSVNIPNNVTSIQYGAFEGCSLLADVFIPKKVELIDYMAFYDCKGLKNVYYGSSKSDWNNINIGLNNQLLTNSNIVFDYTDDFCFNAVNYSSEENTVSVKVNCSSAVYENGGQVIIALYGDKKLIDYYYADAAASVSHIFENLEDLYGTYEIKAFIWSDLTNLIPNKNYISKII